MVPANARKFLNEKFQKDPKPSTTEMNELAKHVSWEKKKVYRYFINKRANVKRKEKLEFVYEVPTSNVEDFFKYWEKQITGENLCEETTEEFECYGCYYECGNQEAHYDGCLKLLEEPLIEETTSFDSQGCEDINELIDLFIS